METEPKPIHHPKLTTFETILRHFPQWEVKSAPQPGKYAMWWRGTSRLSFGDSDAKKFIDRAYQALDGIETYVFTSILTYRDLLDGPASLVDLPEELFAVYLYTHEKQPFFFSASQEKGLRFHFHVDQVAEEQRDSFWQFFAEYAEVWRRYLLDRGQSVDNRSGVRPIEWWQLTTDAVAIADSSGANAEIIGSLVI